MKEVVLALLLASVTTAASAQDVDASTAAAARELYQQGVSAGRAEEWSRAIELFERSYELAPRAATTLNLAQVQERAGRLVAALASYRRFLATADERLLRSHGDAAREAIAAIEPRVAHLSVVALGLEPGDEVRLDGAILEQASLGLDLPVDPGEHRVSITRVMTTAGPDGLAGEGPVECAADSVNVAEGGRRDLELSLRCPTPFVVDLTPPPPPPDDPTLAIVLGVGGGLVAVGAVVLVVVLVASPSTEPPFVGNVGMGAYVVR